MKKSAVISECGLYRYQLHRSWDDSKPTVMFIMLNPSTADAEQDDPTIRRCINFAKAWGYGSLCVGNLFALRATKPTNLLGIPPFVVIGFENENHLQEMYNKSDAVVCAWGNPSIAHRIHKPIEHQYKPLSGMTEKLYYLELGKTGVPKHPLYLKASTTLKTFKAPLRWSGAWGEAYPDW